MIDTIIIKIPEANFNVPDGTVFSPDFTKRNVNDMPRHWIQKPQKAVMKYVQNASTDDKKEGVYKPCITIWRRYEEGKFEYNLYVQFSAPKLINNDNLSELSEKCLPGVVEKLAHKLKTMGVLVSDSAIYKAQCTKFHVGKNISIPKPWTSSEFIAQLKMAEIGKQMDVTSRDYKNGGQSLYFYNVSHNHIFYDKVKDLQKCKALSDDKDKVLYEKILGKRLEKNGEHVLRFETRFNNAQLVKKIVNQNSSKKFDVIYLESLFNEAMWKSCLLKEWHSIINRQGNKLAFKMELSPEEVFNVFIQKKIESKKDGHSLNQVFIKFGLYYIIRIIGIKELKSKINTIWNNKTCEDRLNEKIENAAIDLEEIPQNEVIAYIEKTLQDFEKYTVQ